jgi:hypothetical protein
MLFHQVRSADAELKAKIVKATGGNEWTLPWPLPNMKPIKDTEFWSWRTSYTFSGEVWAGSRRIDIDGKPTWANLMVYWLGHGHYEGGGFAVAVVRDYQAEKVLYFDWRACEHTFAQKNIGNCLNRYTCTKCGASHDVDSSG